MFKHMNVSELLDLLENDTTTIVDIRDPASFEQGHIPNSSRLDNSNVAQFIADTNKDNTVVVCCYHGNSSQSAAQFLAEQGFSDVYSLDGGFTMWQSLYPDRVSF